MRFLLISRFNKSSLLCAFTFTMAVNVISKDTISLIFFMFINLLLVYRFSRLMIQMYISFQEKQEVFGESLFFTGQSLLPLKHICQRNLAQDLVSCLTYFLNYISKTAYNLIFAF